MVSAAGAEGYATVGTTLTIAPPASVTVGSPSIVVMHLISSKNEPVANQRVELFVDGVHERTARTDAAGSVSIKVRRDLAGSYKLYATFKGSKLPSLGSSKASTDLVVTPATIEIHTTPSLSNVKFSLDNHIFSSDDHGVARIEVKKAGKYQLKLLPLEIQDANIQMGFDRWVWLAPGGNASRSFEIIFRANACSGSISGSVLSIMMIVVLVGPASGHNVMGSNLGRLREFAA